MTKDKFCELINFIKEKKLQEDLLCDTFETLCPGEYVNAFIFSEYETHLVEVIKDALGLSEDNTDIEYFLYELNFGAEYKPGMLTDNGVDIDFSTAEKLYEYLTKGVTNEKNS